MSLNVNLISLNVRGIREYKKNRKSLNWIVKHGGKNGISFLQETHSCEDNEHLWKHRFKGEILFSHGAKNSRGVAILIGEKLEYKILSVKKDDKGRLIIIQCEIQGKQFLLINSYFPNEENQQISFLKTIFQKVETFELSSEASIIWGGDFNFVRNILLETAGGNPRLKTGSIEQLMTILQDLDLVDIWRVRNPNSKRFTWQGKAQGRASGTHEILFRRLDFFYISNALQPLVQDADILPAPATDHSALTLHIKSLPNNKYGPSFWKFNNSLLEDVAFIKLVKKQIETEIKEFKKNLYNPHTKWELIKYELRKLSISYSKEKAKNTRNRYKEIEGEIKTLEEIMDWQKNEDLLQKHENLKRKLNEISDYITKGIIMRSKVIWHEQGEKNSKFFLTLEKRRKNKTHVRKILIEDKEISNPYEILEKLEHFYSTMYTPKHDLSVEQCSAFLHDIDTPKLSEEDQKSCEGFLTIKECYESLKEMGNSKTPGIDGFSKEFYMTFWLELGEMMVDCFNYSFNIGTLTTTQNQVCITLLEKPDKDVRLIENWRPISLINVDAKICSKALCNRMKKLMPKLIHPNQSAFVKGRTIDEAVRFLVDLFDFAERNNKSFILFAADFQKAFDSIEHNFIIATLRHFGFGDNFINWIKIILISSKSCIMNNGTASNFFELQRGTKQGDPISPYLFIMTIEIMAQLIRDNKDIEGIKLTSEIEETKLVLFADDASFCTKNIQSLQNILLTLEKFKMYSSLQLNLEKSEVGCLGKENINLNDVKIKKKIDLKSDGIKILGIHLSQNKEYVRINNFDRVFQKFKSVLSMWKMRTLTLYGKAQVVRSLAMSQLLYVCSKLAVPKTFSPKVEKEIARFIWNGRKVKIKYKTLIGDINDGGIRLPDLETVIQTNRVIWGLKLINDSKGCWKIFAENLLQNFGGFTVIGENFDIQKIDQKKLPAFYKEVFNAWSKISSTNVVKTEDILRQPLWLNKFITLQLDHINVKRFTDKQILTVSDVWGKNNKPNWEEIKTIGKWKENDYFTWRSIIDALPQQWKFELKKVPTLESIKEGKFIEISNQLTHISKITSKMVYWDIIKKKFKTPTSQKHISEKLNNKDIEWVSIYKRVYSLTNNLRLREFQYKILNNCIFLNEKLFKCKIVESPLCTFCELSNESIDHFFVQCDKSKNLYLKINQWLSSANIRLPDLNIENVTIGGSNDNTEEFLFLLYKYALYSCKQKQVSPSIHYFQNLLIEYEKTEYISAKNNNKLYTHLRKYENIQHLIYELY